MPGNARRVPRWIGTGLRGPGFRCDIAIPSAFLMTTNPARRIATIGRQPGFPSQARSSSTIATGPLHWNGVCWHSQTRLKSEDPHDEILAQQNEGR